MKSFKKGFTAVEIVIVIAVIAILAGAFIAIFSSVNKNAERSKALGQASEAYAIVHAEDPTRNNFIIKVKNDNKEYIFVVKNNKIEDTPYPNETEALNALGIDGTTVEENEELEKIEVNDNNVTVWSLIPDAFTIKYFNNPGDIEPIATVENLKVGDLVTLRSDEPSVSGYVFAGWSNGTETYPAGYLYTMSSNNVNFFAVWESGYYTITYVTDDGTINSGQLAGYTYGVGGMLPVDVSKTGFTFGGWYESSSFDGSPVTAILTSDKGNKTFYAKWEAAVVTTPDYWTDEGAYDISWYTSNPSALTYTLNTPEQFAGLSVITSGLADGVTAFDFSGRTIYLGADISLEGTSHNSSGLIWVPIGNYNCYFNGTLDGQNHSIDYMKTVNIWSWNNNFTWNGLFGIGNAHIKNLVMESHCTVESIKAGFGTIVGRLQSSGSIENCVNKADIIFNNASSTIGGIVAYNYGGVITNCRNEGAIDCTAGSFPGSYVGGIAGYNMGGGKVVGCSNTANVSGESYIGGIVGSLGNSYIVNCSNVGAISGQLDVGGIVGITEGIRYNGDTSNAPSQVLNCYNRGAVSGIVLRGQPSNAGGIVGMNSGSCVKNCYNVGNVSSAAYFTSEAGSIIGENSLPIFTGHDYAFYIENCYYLNGSASGGAVGDDNRTAPSGTYTAMTLSDITASTFVNTLNAFVTTYNESYSDVTLATWKAESGNSPVFN